MILLVYIWLVSDMNMFKREKKFLHLFQENVCAFGILTTQDKLLKPRGEK